MKTVNLKIKLNFSENITDITEVTRNVACAILGEACSGQGIAPENEEGYLETADVISKDATFKVDVHKREVNQKDWF